MSTLVLALPHSLLGGAGEHQPGAGHCSLLLVVAPMLLLSIGVTLVHRSIRDAVPD